jgi:hypothetical protein
MSKIMTNRHEALRDAPRGKGDGGRPQRENGGRDAQRAPASRAWSDQASPRTPRKARTEAPRAAASASERSLERATRECGKRWPRRAASASERSLGRSAITPGRQGRWPRRVASASERSLERSGEPWGPERRDGPSQAKPDVRTATRDSQGVRGIGVHPPEEEGWTSSVRTPPRSAGCRNAIDAPIEPCRGRVSISRTRPPASIVASASVTFATA